MSSQSPAKTYSIHELATLSGVSVRTLHYYDEVGLLSPQERLENGYRVYGKIQLLRLQEILFFKELDFSLEHIKKILYSSSFHRETALQEQKHMLGLKVERLKRLIHTIDSTLSMNNQNIQDEELYDAFKDDDVKQYQEEVKQRWGNTDAYKQSMARVQKMTKAQMEKFKQDGRAHTQAIADNMHKGVEHPDVQALIQKSYEGINFFYECSIDMFQKLGQMYVDDPRFTAYYEQFGPGLAVFMRDAIHVYCSQHQ